MKVRFYRIRDGKTEYMIASRIGVVKRWEITSTDDSSKATVFDWSIAFSDGHNGFVRSISLTTWIMERID